ncbi:hypothetical protein [Streptacidiphilus sp. PAMC 29251]
MRAPTRVLIPAVLALALCAAGLTGCSVLPGGGGCEGTAPRLEQLAALPVLTARPPTALPHDGAAANSWCDPADSSSGVRDGAWLNASRTYDFPGNNAALLDFYRAAAIREGWILQADLPRGLCYFGGSENDGLVLTVEPWATGATPHTGGEYAVTVATSADGGAPTC